MGEFILSTNDLNRHGYRVLTEGIDITNFLKNPVMYWEHEGYRKPIGRWTKLRKENDNLIGTPVFDENDEEAKVVKDKVEQGIVNATSIHCNVVELSGLPEHLVQGQTRETVTKSELLEVSFTGIPGNGKAVRLSANEKYEFIPLLNNQVNMKKIALSLGLPENATEDQILEVVTLNKKTLERSSKHVDTLIALGEANGHINADNKESFRKLAASDYDTVFSLFTKSVADAKGGEGEGEKEDPITMTALLNAIKSGVSQDADPSDKSKWTFDRWQKEDPSGLLSIKQNKPEEYKKLVLAHTNKK